MYEDSYRQQFEKLGIWYEHRLIDDMFAQVSCPSFDPLFAHELLHDQTRFIDSSHASLH